MSQINRLCTRSVEFESKPAAEGEQADGRTLEGYGAVFDTPTRINNWEGDFEERISPGAFSKTLSERKPIMQYDHGRDARTGSVPIGAIQELREDPKGLYVCARLFDNPIVEPIRQAIEGGAISGMSFKFNVKRDEWRDGKGALLRPEELGRLLHSAGDRGPLQRNIKEVQLFEVGPVATPAYSGTSVGVRSLTEEEREALVEEYRKTMDVGEEIANAEVVDLTGEDEEGEERASLPMGTKEAVQHSWVKLHHDQAFRKSLADGEWAALKSKLQAAANKFGIKLHKDPLPDNWKKFGDGHFVKSDEAEVDERTEISETDNSDAAHEGTSKKVEDRTDDAAPEGTSSKRETENTPRKAVPMAKTIAELRARLDEISERMAELSPEGSETRSLEEAEQTEFDTLDAEATDVEHAIDQIVKRGERLKSLAARGASEKGSENGHAPAFHKSRSEEDVFDLEEARKLSYSGDDFLERVTDNAKRAIEKAQYGTSKREDAQETAMRHLEDSDTESRDLAKRMLLTGSKEYEKAYVAVLRNGSDAFCSPEGRQALIRAVQSLGTDAGGGYAVPFQLDPSVMLTSSGIINPIRQLADVTTIVGKEWQGVTSAGTTVARAGENALATASNFTLASPKVRTNRVQGYTVFSIEIDLSWSALRSEITKMLVDAKAHEEESFWSGTGDGITDGQPPQGLNAGLAGGGNDVTCAAVDTFTLADLYALEEALDARWESAASFAAHKTVINAIRQFPTDNTQSSTPGSLNNLVVHSLQDGIPGRLLDQPLARVTGLPTLAAAKAYAGTHADGGDTLMIYGDFKQFKIVDRIGMSTEVVQTVVGTGGFPTGQRGVFTYWMNNSKIIIPAAFKRLLIKQT